ncbi:4-phosphoerythronate dehydrogenase [Ghiorsea bivora]|uniref:4-phosphoerythronate dehydrogenase n=1 Tax=Ghiorsea bivora TaxID=1485545 RepID=UPI00068DEEF3|nr:4-phosphoerythronate dehydrogenase [Ghiorsea bivora]
MTTPLTIIADSNIWGVNDAFQTLEGLNISLRTLPLQQIDASQLNTADVLLTRSGIQIDEALLHNSPVRFVGTATIGDDHVDKLYLQSQAITFTSAAGSSTQSVVEYMLTVFFTLENMGKLSFSKDKLGIIGVGRIGSLLNQACGKLGLETLLNDPPRGLNTSLDDALETADILTLHTPLTHDGEHATHHLLDADKLSQFKGKGIINAGRGACIDNQALLDWLNQDVERFAVLDCWENEPNIYLDLLNHAQVLIATPHIAGHSLDGKAANTYFIYKDLCDFLQISPTWSMQAALPDIAVGALSANMSKSELALAMYPIDADTQAMKQAGKSDNFKAWFSSYRKNYPVRRAWDKVLAIHNLDKELFF